MRIFEHVLKLTVAGIFAAGIGFGTQPVMAAAIHHPHKHHSHRRYVHAHPTHRRHIARPSDDYAPDYRPHPTYSDTNPDINDFNNYCRTFNGSCDLPAGGR